MENLFSATNKSFENAISHNLTSTISDNYKIQHKHDIEKIENTQTVSLLVSILAVFTLIIILLLFKSIYQRQKNIIKEKIIFAEQLAESIKSNNDSTVLREIMEGQYTLLDNLVKQFSLNVSPSNYSNTMSHAITNLINSLYVSDSKFKKMEMNVDKTFNNLFSDFKHDLPNLKEADYRIFLFSVLRLSAPTMALLLGEEKLTAIYERKRRLKGKIGRLNESKRDKYKPFI